jgi:hypothetical protein
MNIKTRLAKLEKKTGKPETRKIHMVIVEAGRSQEEAVEEFKHTHDVSLDDAFTIIQFVKPDPKKWRK